MAAPAPRRDRPESAPTPLPAIERNLRAERAKRRARIEHDRERRAARRRFAFLLLLLVVAVFFLALTILDQIRSLFGI
jgi:ferric-dicitrate binding protein FerR (iron transport regulator)